VDAGLPEATSVFFGGGTPSLVPASLLAGLVRAIPVAPGAEITVECNPDDVTGELLDAYHAAGVNRLSMGVQSMVPHVLAALGRLHRVENVTRAVALVRRVGFPSFNVDLIFGAVGERDDDWRATLDAIVDMGPPHVSAYALTVEPGTPLAADPSRHPDDDIQAGRYVLADRLLADAGLSNYEISNWARPGHECQHNLLYWSQGDYQGIGCAAHSHRAGRRWWNVRTPERYIALVNAGRSPVADEERLVPEERQRERWQLALRMPSGVPAVAWADEDLAELAAAQLVTCRADRVVLTTRGRLLANEVARRLR
jgi:oxygen-independent coproporphyrinogen-3 oxidase